MTTQELQPRLKSLFEAHREAAALISRLYKLGTLSTTGSPRPEDSESRVELSAEIHQSLKEQEEEYELLKQEVEDYTSGGSWGSGGRRRDSEKDRDRISVVTQVERLGEDLKLARAQFRKAQLQAKRNEEAAKRKERELLFAGVQVGDLKGGPGRRKGQEKLSQDDLLVNASSDVTATLRRTHQLMQSELSRSQFANETLKESTAALTSLNENYGTLDNLLSSSRSLVSTLISSQKSDTWYLESAFKILVYTIIWLILRRWILGPAKLIFYPVKWMLSIVSLLLNVTIGAFINLVGAGSTSSQSSALSNNRTLIVPPSATGDFPKFRPNMAAPSVGVGAGGKGAKAGAPRQVGQVEQVAQGDESLTDKVGKIIDGNEQEPGEPSQSVRHEDGTVLRERKADEPPNPKKRMFEEPPPARQEAHITPTIIPSPRAPPPRTNAPIPIPLPTPLILPPRPPHPLDTPLHTHPPPPRQHPHPHPVHQDHCFARIIYDHTLGATKRPWTSTLKSPAIQHTSRAQLAACIALGEQIAAGTVDLGALDTVSLAVRGKTKPGTMSTARGKRPRALGGDEVNGGKVQKVRRVAGAKQRDIRDAMVRCTPRAGDDGREGEAVRSKYFADSAPPTAAALTPPTSPLPGRHSSHTSVSHTAPDSPSPIPIPQYPSSIPRLPASLPPHTHRVLLALLQVPPGAFTTYGSLARFLRSSPRAVGAALKNNPFPPTIPCHRVLAADGGVGGYMGQWGAGEKVERKVELLRVEGVRFDGRGKAVGGAWGEWR